MLSKRRFLVQEEKKKADRIETGEQKEATMQRKTKRKTKNENVITGYYREDGGMW